jgi:hypothetical protein
MAEASGGMHLSHRSPRGLQAEALYSLETLLMSGKVVTAAFEIRHGTAPAGDPVLSLHRADDGTPVSFASIHLERPTGRFYRTYSTGWGDLVRGEERHYFTDAHDAAAYVGFLLTRLG